LAVFLSMNVMVFTMALWTTDVHVETDTASAASGVLRGLFRYLCLLFALPVLFLLGGPLLENAWQNLRRGVLNTDLLLVLGVISSYVYSAISVFRDTGAVYFEVGCAVLVLVTLGRWLEATGRLRTTAALESLQKFLPAEVRVLRDGKECWVPLDEVGVGDCLRVLAGERVPCDGQVLHQAVTVDEQVVTGESQPTIKEWGDAAYGGSLNLDGDLVLRVTASARHGTMSRMIDLVRRARQSKGSYERLADRVSAWFLPGVVLIATAATVWHGSQHDFQTGILTGLAVLLIACPCALGLATPMAVWAALGQSAQMQVLFRNGETLERLAAVRALRLDKTGTVTTGSPSVAEFAVEQDAEREDVLLRAKWLASGSTHGYARAITEYTLAPRHQHLSSQGQDVQTLPGRGLMARCPEEGRSVYLGSPRLMTEASLIWGQRLSPVLASALRHGEPLTCVGWDGLVRGLFVFREQLRPEARQALERLRRQGLDVALLTGDSVARGASIGRELGLVVNAGLLPEDKVAAIESARRTIGPVAMVGDGINDCPALAASDVGIALGCGTDVARDSAAVCLVGNDLLHLPQTIELARRTVRVIRQNLFWAFVYNVAGIALACTGQLSPVVAALAMVLSSLLVITNSLRLAGNPSADEPQTARTAAVASVGEGMPLSMRC
jgi:heavy metal translocating P-type ATPase